MKIEKGSTISDHSWLSVISPVARLVMTRGLLGARFIGFLCFALSLFPGIVQAASQNAANQRYTNNSDGFSLAGGTTVRTLTVISGDITLTGSGAYTYTYPGATTTLVGIDTTQTLTNKTWNGESIGVPYGGTGATTLTGILKGSGTSAVSALTGSSNYTARWTDANTIGTGVLFDNGTNVGIGTTAPAAKLEVDGAVYAPAGTGVSVSHTPVALGTAGNAMFGRNVEIDGALYVDSGIYFTGALVGDGSRLSGIPVASSTANAVPKSTGSTLVDSGIYAVGSNVGIGTTNPQAQFQVQTADSGVMIYGTAEVIGTGKTAYIDARVVSGQNLKIIAGGYIDFQAYAIGNMPSIFSAHSIAFADSSIINWNGAALTGGTGQGLGITTYYGTTFQKTAAIGPTVIIKRLIGQTSNLLEWQADDASVLSVISSAGNVGIGTIAPFAGLQVDGGIYASAGVAPSHSPVALGTAGNAMFGRNVEIDGALYVDSGIYFTGALVGDGSRLTNVATSTMITQNDTTVAVVDGDNAPIKFSVDGSTSVVIDHNGNIGIGTTAPAYKIDVSGSISSLNGSIYVRSTNASVGTYSLGDIGFLHPGDNGNSTLRAFMRGYNDPTGAWYLGTALTFWTSPSELAAAVERLRIDRNGNIGIGTISPVALLEVDGAVYAPAGTGVSVSHAQVALGTAGNAMFGRNVEIDGALYVDSGIYFTGALVGDGSRLSGIAAASSTINAVSKSTGSVLVDSGIYAVGSNVGIGTSAPGATLEVGGSIIVGGSGNTWFTNNVGVGTSVPAAKLQVAGTGTTTSKAFQITDSSYAAKVTVLDSGNVGIGSSDPTALLDLPGNSLTSSLKVGTLEYQSFGTNNGWIADNMYNNGTNFVHRALGAAGLFYFQGTEGQYRFYVSHAAGYSEGTGVGSVVQMKINQTGEFGVGSGISNSAAVFTGANFYVGATGNVGIGTTVPSGKLDINGNVLRLRTAKTPSSASDTCNQGEIAWDTSYLYVCIATNTWKRSAISTW